MGCLLEQSQAKQGPAENSLIVQNQPVCIVRTSTSTVVQIAGNVAIIEVFFL